MTAMLKSVSTRDRILFRICRLEKIKALLKAKGASGTELSKAWTDGGKKNYDTTLQPPMQRLF